MTVAAALRRLGVLRGILPDIRDLHVYGGAGLIAWGVSAWYPPAWRIVFGAALLYLGLRRPR